MPSTKKTKTAPAKTAGRLQAFKAATRTRLAPLAPFTTAGWQTAALVIASALIYLFRASTYLWNPQLYAEDGAQWLADGYNHGLAYVFHPVGGFLHIPERLFGFVAAQLPLHQAPALFNLTAWAIFMLFCYYLFTRRTRILNNAYERVFMFLAVAMIANLEEFFFNFSNTIFLLGIIGVAIIAADKPRHKIQEIGEKILYALICFTLPFAWFFLPVTLVERFKYKRKDNFYLYFAAIATVAQVICYLTAHFERSAVTFGSLWSKFGLLEVYNQIIVPATRFARIDTPIFHDHNNWQYPVYAVYTAAIILLVASIYVIRRARNRQLWYMLFFLFIITFASLKSPQIPSDNAIEAIKFMSIVGGGDRYFVFGILFVNIIMAKLTYDMLGAKFRYWFMAAFFTFGWIAAVQYHSFYVDKHFADLRDHYHASIDVFNRGKVKKIDIVVNPANFRDIVLYRK